MNTATKHRGPDATGCQLHKSNNGDLWFGHNRLKIIDPSHEANQPFVSACGNYVLLFNGEIYNYQSLQKKLPQNQALRSQSDTEVLLYLLIHFGTAILPALNGMFAFVFYDKIKNETLIARDRFGMKPLYYHQSENCFIASSELRGILASGLVKQELNMSQIPAYLRHKYVPKPATFFKAIDELEEAHYIHIKAGKCSKACYFDDNSIEPKPDLQPQNLTAQVGQLLTDSVRAHLIADVPCGLLLSGGVDSTLLLAYIAAMGIDQFPTFSVVNAAHESNYVTSDYLYARKAAQQFGAAHHELEITPDQVANQFQAFVTALDQPVADSAAMLTWLICGQAKNEVKVLLSGAGADELFAGYNRHTAYYFYLQYLQKVPWQLMRQSGLKLPTGFDHPLRKLFSHTNQLIAQATANPYQTFVNFTTLSGFDNSFFKEGYQDPQSNPIEPANLETENYLRLALHYDRSQYLIGDILAITDKTSMQHGVEVRLPFLTNELLQATLQTPAQTLFGKGRKWVLKTLLNQKNGEIFTNRPKEGFGMPLGQWLKQPSFQPIVAPLFNTQHPIYEVMVYEKVMDMVQKHHTNQRDFTQELWALATLATWIDEMKKPSAQVED